MDFFKDHFGAGEDSAADFESHPYYYNREQGSQPELAQASHINQNGFNSGNYAGSQNTSLLLMQQRSPSTQLQPNHQQMSIGRNPNLSNFTGQDNPNYMNQGNPQSIGRGNMSTKMIPHQNNGNQPGLYSNVISRGSSINTTIQPNSLSDTNSNGSINSNSHLSRLLPNNYAFGMSNYQGNLIPQSDGTNSRMLLQHLNPIGKSPSMGLMMGSHHGVNDEIDLNGFRDDFPALPGSNLNASKLSMVDHMHALNTGTRMNGNLIDSTNIGAYHMHNQGNPAASLESTNKSYSLSNSSNLPGVGPNQHLPSSHAVGSIIGSQTINSAPHNLSVLQNTGRLNANNSAAVGQSLDISNRSMLGTIGNSTPLLQNLIHENLQASNSITSSITNSNPSTVVTKEMKYGLSGLLDVIRMTDKDLNTLALGTDLTAFGLNLNSAENLFPSFTSPFADNVPSSEPSFVTPACYNMQSPSLKSDQLSKFLPETLFYMFYTMPKDVLQACAAQELYRRDWKYNGEYKLWLKARSAQEMMQNQQGVHFIYFDVHSFEQRPFNTPLAQQRMSSILNGLLPEEEIRVKVPASMHLNNASVSMNMGGGGGGVNSLQS